MTARTVIRCYDPADAPRLQVAILESLEHLRPWMPWLISEPETIARKTARLREFRAQFDRDENYTYGVFARDETTVLGSTGLHPRVGVAALSIGYWIHVAHAGKGLATEVAAALTRVGFEILGLERIEIHCAPENTRSIAVPRKLGFSHEATLQARLPDSEGHLRDQMIWSLFADDYPASPAARFEIAAFDAIGAPLPLRAN